MFKGLVVLSRRREIRLNIASWPNSKKVKNCLLWVSCWLWHQIVKSTLLHITFFGLFYLYLTFFLKKLSQSHRCLFSKSKILHISLYTGQGLSLLNKNEPVTPTWMARGCQATVAGTFLWTNVRQPEQPSNPWQPTCGRETQHPAINVLWAPWFVPKRGIYRFSCLHLDKTLLGKPFFHSSSWF